MKTYIYALSIIFLAIFAQSCGEEDVDVYPVTTLTDTQEDFEALSLNSRTTNLVIEKLADGEVKELGAIVAFAGAPRSSDISYSFEVVDPTNVAVGTQVQVATTGVVAAGQTTGVIPIMVNLDAFEIGVPSAISIRLTSSDISITDSKVVTYTFSVICPSDLAGEYSATTVGQSTDPCCPDPVTVTGDAVISGSGGAYVITDFTAGIYVSWYGVYGITPAFETDGRLNGPISDVCGVITGAFSEPFGSDVALNGTSDGSGVITYTWTNGFGDTATTTLTKK